MSIFDVISLMGGLALFLYGMRVMGDALKQGSTGALKKAMAMVTGNPFLGFLLGFVVTGVIQSSHATIVLTSGLVGAGILSLHQSIGIIIGANLGTTVTGQIIRLLDLNGDAAAWVKLFQPSTLAPVAAVIGIIFVMAARSKKFNLIGNVLLGFGVLFTGLMNMTAAVSPLSQSAAFASLFTSFADKPVLGYITGACAAFALQSSSATIGILQALASTGQLSFGSIYAIIVGIYLGDCVTAAIVCSIGAIPDAKRTGIIHVLYGISKSVLILILITIFHKLGFLDAIWNKAITSGGIANAHTLFNLIAAAVLLPICTVFEKISRKLVKDKKAPETEATRLIESLSPALFDSPALALQASKNVLDYMSKLAKQNVRSAFEMIKAYDEKSMVEVNKREDDLDNLTDHLGDYLSKLITSNGQGMDTIKLNYYVKCTNEFERIGDLAMNICENAETMKEKNINFTDDALHEITVLSSAIDDIVQHTVEAFDVHTKEAASYIEPIEEVIDDIVNTMKNNHFKRIERGDCSMMNGYCFLDILTNYERISDQCANVGVHTISFCDPVVADSEHEYVRRLHAGEDEDFNRKFELYRNLYYTQIEEIGKK